MSTEITPFKDRPLRERVLLAAVARHAADEIVTKTVIAKSLGISKQVLTKIRAEDFDAISKEAKSIAAEMTDVKSKRTVDDIQRAAQAANENAEEERAKVARQQLDVDLLLAYVSQIHDASESELHDEVISQGAKKTPRTKERILNSVPDLPTEKEEEAK